MPMPATVIQNVIERITLVVKVILYFLLRLFWRRSVMTINPMAPA